MAHFTALCNECAVVPVSCQSLHLSKKFQCHHSFIVKLMENQTETTELELIDVSLVRSHDGIVLEDT